MPDFFLSYPTRTPLEKFGLKIYRLLVENFPATYFVGGTVRDLLRKKNISDVDLATSAQPRQVVEILKMASVEFDDRNRNFGIIVALKNGLKAEIATFRKDLPGRGRYPKVQFVSSAKVDSARRDFTINSLYLEEKTGQILDFHDGMADLKNGVLKFIGKPKIRIQQDPLRVVRGWRFIVQLSLSAERRTAQAMADGARLLNSVPRRKIEAEINKLSSTAQKKILLANMEKYFLLDKHAPIVLK